MERVRLEICCSDIGSVLAAKEGGADCIELCSSLETGGITPSAALIERAAEIFPGAVNVLIRPRPGDFLYDDDEVGLILKDIAMARRFGASGVVCGALTEDGDIDMDALRLMLEASGGLRFTFHRAFDLCNDPDMALEQLIAAGCHTLLTSGCAPSAEAGMAQLKLLVDKAQCPMESRLPACAAAGIEIKAAAGINHNNVARIVKTCGLKSIHASAKNLVQSSMKYRNTAVAMGASPSDEYSHIATSAENVAAIRKVLDTL